MMRPAPRPTRSPILFICLVAGLFSPLAAGAQEPFYRDGSAQVTELREAYSHAGRVFPQGATPISRLRLMELADGNLADSLSLERPVQIRASVDMALEAYLETKDRQEPFYDQYQRVDPLAQVHLSAQTQAGPALHMRFDFQREYRQNTWSNVPYPASGNPVPLENDNVRWGVLYLPLAGDQWSFETVFGRQPVHVGPSPLGSLGPSRRLPHLDALRVNLHIGDLTMTHIVSQLENRPAPGDVAVPNASDTYDYDITRILFNTHYFEYAFDRLRLGIGAWVLASRPNNYYHLNDFFPVFSWHNAEIEPKNMCFLGDVSYAFLPGLEGYAQLGFDDLRGGGVGVGDTDVPSIDAYLAGVRYWTRLAGRPLFGFAEAGYTHYLWGNYRDDVALSKAIYRLNVDDGNQTMPLTSPYGPGVIWFAGAAESHLNDSLRVAVDYELLWLNTAANLFSTAYTEDDDVKSADRDLAQRLQVEVAWKPIPPLELAMTPGITTYEDDIRGELQLTARSSFSTGGTR